MTVFEKYDQFKNWHQPGQPLILYNIWDAGSAKQVVNAGAKAVATGSKPLAVSQGYLDGEKIPFGQLLTTVEQITSAVSVPISIDFESGYAGQDLTQLSDNVSRLLGTGVVGINFEDQNMAAGGVFDIETQVERITTIRRVARDLEKPIFINARTDLFLQEKDKSNHPGLLEAAVSRAQAFQQAGADGFFAPGLDHTDLIKELCEQVSLPVNIIKVPTAPDNMTLAQAGVARISYGPFAYQELMDTFRERATQVFG